MSPPTTALTLRPVEPAPRDGHASVEAPAGTPLTFHGCAGTCCPPPDLRVAGVAGQVVARAGAWDLTNLSTDLDLTVWCLDDPSNATRVLPGMSVSPPFDLAGVTGAAGHVLTVFGPHPAPARHRRCVADVPVAWGLEPTSRRHAVMVELVRCRLSGDLTTPPPTAREIGVVLGMSHRTVQEHIRALVDVLGISAPSVPRPGWARDALTTFALTHTYLPRRGITTPW